VAGRAGPATAAAGGVVDRPDLCLDGRAPPDCPDRQRVLGVEGRAQAGGARRLERAQEVGVRVAPISPVDGPGTPSARPPGRSRSARPGCPHAARSTSPNSRSRSRPSLRPARAWPRVARRPRRRHGVGHLEHGRHAAQDGRPRAGQPVLLVLEARLAEVDVAVDHAGQHEQLARVELIVLHGRGVEHRARDGGDAAPAMAMSKFCRPAPVTSVPLRTTRSKRAARAARGYATMSAMEHPRAHPLLGFYGPDSMMWRINREAVLLGAGPAALLLQIAHPSVAERRGRAQRLRGRPVPPAARHDPHDDGAGLRRRPGRRARGAAAERHPCRQALDPRARATGRSIRSCCCGSR
jgi:hypothetical protein